MTLKLKRLVVISLEKLCGLIDRYIPWWYTGCWLSLKSAELDEHWGTGEWEHAWIDWSELDDELNG